MSKMGRQYDFFDKSKDYTETKTDRTTKKWIRVKEAQRRYSVSRTTVMKWAMLSGALHKIDTTNLIDSEVMELYIESFRVPGEVC